MTAAEEGGSDDRSARLARFAELVATAPHNLVSRNARGHLLTRHIPESILLARLLPADFRVLDVGTGGGFPGFVIALVRPDLDVHLLDSTAKKTGFLAGAARQLSVPVTVHTGRAEVLAKSELRSSFDVVTARAVAPLVTLLPLTVPFLHPLGRLYAVKGVRWAEEVDEAADALGRLGLRVLTTPDENRSALEMLRDPLDGTAQAPGDVVPKVVVVGRDAPCAAA